MRIQTIGRRARLIAPLAATVLLLVACGDPTGPESGDARSTAAAEIPVGLSGVLWGSTADDFNNPASLYTIDETTGGATLLGSTGIAVGNERVSAIDFDPITGVLYGIKGGPCFGAILITLDPLTGAGAVVGTLKGGWFDGTPGPSCPRGSAAIAFDADGTLYASGWYGGIPQGKIMRVDKATGTVLEVHPTPLGYDDWRGRRAHFNGLAFDANGTLWASRGNSVTRAQINTLDPANGDVTGTVYLDDPVMEDSLTISDLAFGPDGNLYATLPWEGMLAVVDTATGDVTRIGSFGSEVIGMSGLTAMPRLLQFLVGRYWFDEASSGQGPAAVQDDQAAPVDLTISYTSDLAWTTADGNRGLESTAFYHRGIARGDADDTKYETLLHGASRATLAAVASWIEPPYTTTIIGFQTQGILPRRVATLGTDASGEPIVTFRTQNQTSLAVRWPQNLGDGERRTLHVVYDADDLVADRRIRLYVDGVDLRIRIEDQELAVLIAEEVDRHIDAHAGDGARLAVLVGLGFDAGARVQVDVELDQSRHHARAADRDRGHAVPERQRDEQAVRGPRRAEREQVGRGTLTGIAHDQRIAGRVRRHKRQAERIDLDRGQAAVRRRYRVEPDARPECERRRRDPRLICLARGRRQRATSRAHHPAHIPTADAVPELVQHRDLEGSVEHGSRLADLTIPGRYYQLRRRTRVRFGRHLERVHTGDDDRHRLRPGHGAQRPLHPRLAEPIGEERVGPLGQRAAARDPGHRWRRVDIAALDAEDDGDVGHAPLA